MGLVAEWSLTSGFVAFREGSATVGGEPYHRKICDTCHPGWVSSGCGESGFCDAMGVAGCCPEVLSSVVGVFVDGLDVPPMKWSHPFPVVMRRSVAEVTLSGCAASDPVRWLPPDLFMSSSPCRSGAG